MSTHASPLRCLLLVLLLPCGAVRPAETVLDDFPVVIHAGLSGGRLPRGDAFSALPDLPFDAERGYGYVGGYPGRLGRTPARGGDPSWPLAWREGVEKYVLRVPHGEYLVELMFVETDVAAPGLRVFDVLAEDRPLFSAVDIVELAGDFAWVPLTGLVDVRDGWLDLRFIPRQANRSARLSRLRILPVPPGRDPVATPVVRVHGGPGANFLDWDIERSGTIRGYGVFRAESTNGPFVSVTEKPVLTTWYHDWSASPGRTWYYKVCAYDVHGNQSAFAEPVAGTPLDPGRLGLKVYELRLDEGGLSLISQRRDPPPAATGELRHLGALYYVDVSYDTSREAWLAKKSFRLSVQRDRSRRFGQREDLYLSAEARDPTRLREKLSADAAGLLNLATPQVEPVVLILNGRFQGLYFDVELFDKRFRRRAQLDRNGLFTRRTRDDLLARDWKPYGQKVGEEGNLVSLTEFMHKLNRIGDGEMADFLEETLYLDRFIDRCALAALRGDDDRGGSLRYMLRDSRNGRWEFFQDRHHSGGWGILDYGEGWRELLTDRNVRRMLFGDSLGLGGDGVGLNAVLESRFFHVPAMKERYLRRLDAMLEGELSPESFERLVERTAGILRAAALEDTHLWPAAGGPDSVRSAPEKVLEAFRARRERLGSASLRDGGSPALVLSEILAVPSGGRPWVEVRNVSPRPVNAARYRLGSSFRAPRRGATPSGRSRRLPPVEVGAGEFLLVEVTAPLLAEAGGALILSRLPEPGERTVAVEDWLFYGHQTEGVSYGRLPDESGRWASLGVPSPGEPNEAGELPPPPFEYRTGLVRQSTGAFTPWIRGSLLPEDSPRRPAEVLLKHRVVGSAEWESTRMTWDEDQLRYATTLEPQENPLPRAYHFVIRSESGVERAVPLPAPELTCFIPVLPEIRINEVLPRPQRDGSGAGEFVELYNPSEVPVNLGGYFLTDTRRNPAKWRIPADSVVPPGGFLVFYADGLNRGNHTSFKLSNSGEYLGLYGRMEEGNLLVDGIAFRGTRTGESWGALPDGSKNFRVWKDPTPGARNRPKIPEEVLESIRSGKEAVGEPAGKE